MSQSNIDQRLTDLEIQFAHQTALMDELNEIVISQWAEIDRMKKRLDAQKTRLQQVELALPEGTDDNQPPPHY